MIIPFLSLSMNAFFFEYSTVCVPFNLLDNAAHKKRGALNETHSSVKECLNQSKYNIEGTKIDNILEVNEQHRIFEEQLLAQY